MEFNFDGPSGPLGIALALIVGLGAVGYGVYGYSAQSAALDSTERVEATVVSTSIERIEDREGPDDYSSRVTFTYTYEGEKYTSSNMYPAGISHEFGTKDGAGAQLEGYEPGATVTAYVPPESPGEAFLEHERSKEPLFIAGIGAIFVIGTVVSVLRN